jgi:hypothetical protein
MAKLARNRCHTTRILARAELVLLAAAGLLLTSPAAAAPPTQSTPAAVVSNVTQGSGGKPVGGPASASPSRSPPAAVNSNVAQPSSGKPVGGPASAAAVSAKVLGSASATAGPAAGCPVTIAGPTQVVRAKGEPRVDTYSFTTQAPGERHLLRIDNGGVNGTMRPVTSANVELNGRLVLDPSRFNPKVGTIEQPIEVVDRNQLRFRVAGEPNSGLSFTVFATDSQPPDFVEVVPANGSVVSEPQVTLVVTLDDALSGPASLHCAGIEATPVDGDFACTVPLAAGPNPIELVAADGCGNERREVVTIEYDPPPVVAITSPDDGDLFVLGPVVVTGTVDDPAASVTVNGVPATGRPNFTATVPVRKGPNTLVAVARDAAGGEGSDSVEIMVLSGETGPTVSISSPKDNFVVGGARPLTNMSVDVKGRVRAGGGTSAANRPTVVVNGLAAGVTLRSRQGPQCALFGMCDWDFSAMLALYKGDNPQVIKAVAKDYLDFTDQDMVSGNVDECVKCEAKDVECSAKADGNAVVDAAKGQSNMCHFIDGCSAPGWAGGQDPTNGKLGGSTAFGKDESSNNDLHGLAPRNNLPCNNHDVCYQTCGANKVACDDAMHKEMLAVCRSAYPEETCPYQPNLLKCTQWRDERARCYANADKYRLGLRSKEASVRFDLRQGEYCYPP